MWKYWIGIPLVCLLLAGAQARGQDSADFDTSFRGFVYEDHRPAAQRNATHVRFSYRVHGSLGTYYAKFPLIGARQVWRPDVSNVTRAVVQPLKDDGTTVTAVGKKVIAGGKNLFVTGLYTQTHIMNGKVLNRRTWCAVLQPELKAALLVGSETGFEGFYYTDHSNQIKKVTWKFFRRTPGAPDPDTFEATGESGEYSEERPPGPELWTFERFHSDDDPQPVDVARIEVETRLEPSDTTPLETITVTNPDPAAVWIHAWFETVPGATNPTTAMVHSEP